MKTTAHELARRLLEVPDHPVVLSIVGKNLDDVIESNPRESIDVDESLFDRPSELGDDRILITAYAADTP